MQNRKKENQMDAKNIDTTTWLGAYTCQVSGRYQSDFGIPVAFQMGAAALVATISFSETIRR